jgi:hypothetical protein
MGDARVMGPVWYILEKKRKRNTILEAAYENQAEILEGEVCRVSFTALALLQHAAYLPYLVRPFNSEKAGDTGGYDFAAAWSASGVARTLDYDATGSELTLRHHRVSYFGTRSQNMLY